MVQAPMVEVRTLGAFDVLREGRPVEAGEWQSRKARDLLKILICARGRPMSRERVAELLWPGEPSAKTGNRLSVLLSTLRAVLDPDRRGDCPLVADRICIRLDLARVDVDAESFLALADAGLAAHRAGTPEARDLLAAAEAKYAGDFCDEDLYADWAVQVRDEARAAYVSVTRALAQLAIRQGHTDLAVRQLLRLLRHDPYDEDAHLRMVDALNDAGHYGDARRRYRNYLAKMDEIGVAPTPRPRRLELDA